MDGEGTFTNRYLDDYTVKKIRLLDHREDGYAEISSESGFSCLAPPEVVARIQVGSPLQVELYGGPFGTICGFKLGDEYITRKSDQDIEAERQAWIEKSDRERREQLEKHRSEWIGRTENLPGWLQDRIQTFRERGGEKFETDGWGYELTICELAVLYDKHPDVNARTKYDDLPQEIRDYDEKQGCSGNQHDVAALLARAHREGQSLAGTPSGLTPITGDPFFEGASRG